MRVPGGLHAWILAKRHFRDAQGAVQARGENHPPVHTPPPPGVKPDPGVGGMSLCPLPASGSLMSSSPEQGWQMPRGAQTNDREEDAPLAQAALTACYAEQELDPGHANQLERGCQGSRLPGLLLRGCELPTPMAISLHLRSSHLS